MTTATYDKENHVLSLHFPIHKLVDDRTGKPITSAAGNPYIAKANFGKGGTEKVTLPTGQQVMIQYTAIVDAGIVNSFFPDGEDAPEVKVHVKTPEERKAAAKEREKSGK